MRNRFPGTCYRCAQPVAVGAGHFERNWTGVGPTWRTQHADCAIKFRGIKTPEHEVEKQKRDAASLRRLTALSEGTGRTAQRARRTLRDLQHTAEPTP